MPCWTTKPNQEPEPDCPDVKRKDLPKKPATPIREKEKELVPA